MASTSPIVRPAASTASTTDSASAPLDVDASALLVYRGSKVYISFAGRGDRRTTRHPDVHRLTPAEARAFEDNFPFPLPTPRAWQAEGPVRLGDLVSRVTHRAGITECSA